MVCCPASIACCFVAICRSWWLADGAVLQQLQDSIPRTERVSPSTRRTGHTTRHRCRQAGGMAISISSGKDPKRRVGQGNCRTRPDPGWTELCFFSPGALPQVFIPNQYAHFSALHVAAAYLMKGACSQLVFFRRAFLFRPVVTPRLSRLPIRSLRHNSRFSDVSVRVRVVGSAHSPCGQRLRCCDRSAQTAGPVPHLGPSAFPAAAAAGRLCSLPRVSTAERVASNSCWHCNPSGPYPWVSA